MVKKRSDSIKIKKRYIIFIILIIILYFLSSYILRGQTVYNTKEKIRWLSPSLNSSYVIFETDGYIRYRNGVRSHIPKKHYLSDSKFKNVILINEMDDLGYKNYFSPDGTKILYSGKRTGSNLNVNIRDKNNKYYDLNIYDISSKTTSLITNERKYYLHTNINDYNKHLYWWINDDNIVYKCNPRYPLDPYNGAEDYCFLDLDTREILVNEIPTSSLIIYQGITNNRTRESITHGDNSYTYDSNEPNCWYNYDGTKCYYIKKFWVPYESAVFYSIHLIENGKSKMIYFGRNKGKKQTVYWDNDDHIIFKDGENKIRRLI